jgi:hypothetical protein
MTSPLNNINLIRTKTSSSPQLEAIEGSLRKTAYIALVAVCSVGLIIGIVFFILFQEKTYLETSKQNLQREVTKNIQKEGMYRSIKDRISTVKQVMGNQKQWSQSLDRIMVFVSPPVLSDFSVDDLGKITISLKAESVDSILTTVNGLVSEAKNKRIVNPQLLSFQIGKTGSITATISFSMVFNTL